MKELRSSALPTGAVQGAAECHCVDSTVQRPGSVQNVPCEFSRIHLKRRASSLLLARKQREKQIKVDPEVVKAFRSRL